MGKLFVISAPSGTGKTSLIRAILEDSEVRNTSLGISCTTREPRAQEKDGISYFFVTTERFNEKIKNDEFLEYAEVFGNLYGTPKDWVLARLAKGENVLLELDIQGALQVKEAFQETQTIFIIPPSYDDLEKRLKLRDQDSTDEINRRLKEAKKEVGIGKTFDQIVVNNDFDQALDDLRSFISSGKELSQERKDVVKKSLYLLLD
jgi:guanylate kinase